MTAQRGGWSDIQAASIQALLGVLLRADAQQVADDTPGGISSVSYVVHKEGRRLVVDVTVYGPGDMPVAGYTL